MTGPIAIVGQACLLPGSPDLRSFRSNVMNGVDCVTEVKEGRWGLPSQSVLGEGPDFTWTSRGGHVTHPIHIAELDGLDPLVHWLVHVGKQALEGVKRGRTGAILGNLSFPTEAMGEFAEGVCLGTATGDPRNAFMSGLPAAILANTLGLDGEAWCLDAACASSIFAIKLACDALHGGRADVMLAGAVNRADNLFLHIGFCQLGAMSRRGMSRPFHRDADGLLPAEGCAMVALKRLGDAERDGDAILGVIRGCGLSNDGRGRSLLAPSSEGQQRAMRAALDASGLLPSDIQLFECHATGTPTGDKVEISSLQGVYPGGYLGSLKSNLGHLITVAGAAGLMKVLAAMAEETMPPTLHAEDAIDTGPFSLLRASRPWDASRRRAAVSAFGFGGNNGHLLVEQYRHGAPIAVPVTPTRVPIAVVGLALNRPTEAVTVALQGLRFPPKDLEQSLAQQTLVLQTGRDAVADFAGELPRERTGVYVGMGCDAAITAWGLRWRLPHRRTDGLARRDEAAPPLRAEHVVGTMPNIPANRLSVQLDAGGAGFTIAAEELSGVRALEMACEALRRGEIDVAIVAAVDCANDIRTRRALDALGKGDQANDAAVAFVLAREGNAYAWIDASVDRPPAAPAERRAHAAAGLLDVATAVLRRTDATVPVTALGGQRASIGIRTGPRAWRQSRPAGPVLTIPTHRAVPLFKPQGGTMTTITPGHAAPQRMAPAPSLVGVLDEREGRLARAAPAPASFASAAVPHEPGASLHPIVDAFVTQRARVASVHQAFIHQQMEVHQAFLAGRADATRMMLGMASGAGVTGAVAMPISPPIGPARSARPPVATSPPAPPPTPPPTDARRPTPDTYVAAATASRPAPTPAPELPSGPRLNRAQLEAGSSHSITKIFGETFAHLDPYTRVVRMPMPPLLLADRVLGISGPPHVLGKGTIWTETDVTDASWYLHDGRMPGGIMIESGQADLLLASWQGIDTLNRSERIYRLLGCDLTYLSELPKPGDTLKYDIHIDGHAKLGDVRMFFFHYDCQIAGRPALMVRQGQAGFFTDAELAASGGILWDPAVDTAELGPRAAAIAIPNRTTFEKEHLIALTERRLVDCFGPAFARAQTHTLSPTIAGGRMLFLDRAQIEFDGGPWKHGYLRAEQDISPDSWFFEGHFHNDPCMPGTLMFEGCLQAMQLYLTAMGFTLARDGWRFEPAKDVTSKLRCRGQVIPSSRLLTYEVFVQEIGGGDRPYVKAQVMCTVDGLRCFHADPMVVEMVPDWPLTRMRLPEPDPRPAQYAYASLLACAWGKPTDAFGPMYAPFDSHRKVPRLPGPPYHFISRVVTATGEAGGQKPGGVVEVEYDVPPDAWYFAENGARIMPYAVLLEAALQPCGWLASWTGCTLGTDIDLMFRNLDGTSTLHVDVTPTMGTLRTRATLHKLVRASGMIIVGFKVETHVGATRIFDMDTVFGFFPPEAFANQAGVGSTPEERAFLAAPSDHARDLRATPTSLLATTKMLMLDRVTGHGGDHWRAEKDVIASDWFFKAHFYQDPVQPGSLGIEAMIQLLQYAMVERGMTAGIENPRFEAIASGIPMTWKYRGQVVPENKRIETEVHITRVDGNVAVADASLWVDGKRIYDAKNLGMRVVSGGTGARRLTLAVPVDHAPTWVLPALPMMTMAMTVLSESGATTLTDGVASRWLTFPDGAREISVVRKGDVVSLIADAPFFSARVGGCAEPAAPAPLTDSVMGGPTGEELYASGTLFHGPRFQALDRVLAHGADGATVQLRGGFPPDVLLDAATHAIPHDGMERWFDVKPGYAAYPARLRQLMLFGAPPTGDVIVELRAKGVAKGRPVVTAHLYDDDRLCAYFELEEILLPKGPIGSASPADRRRFLLGHTTPGVSLSVLDATSARLSATTAMASDWLPGTLARVYGSADAKAIAVKELLGAKCSIHPHDVAVHADKGSPERAWDSHHPLTTYTVRRSGDTARLDAPQRIDLERTFAWWRSRIGGGKWPGEGVITALTEAYVADFILHDPVGFAALQGPVLFLANHENYVESALFTTIVSALRGVPTRSLAKEEHRAGWLGAFHDVLTTYPGHEQPPFIVYFDQSKPAELPALVREQFRDHSLLVHVEGTRQTQSGQAITAISSLWVDVAIERGIPIVPVAFRGGVNGERTDLPVGPQDHHVGSAILPALLNALPYAERRKAVIDAINALPSRAVDVRYTHVSAGVSLVELARPALRGADAPWRVRFESLGRAIG